MSRRTLINMLENVFQPGVNQDMKVDLLGKSVKAISTLADATPEIDFSEHNSIHLTLGSVAVTGLSCLTTGMQEGEEVLLVITQDATARTLAWSTGFKFAGGAGPTITAANNAVDVFKGVVVGGYIVLSVVAQNIS